MQDSKPRSPRCLDRLDRAMIRYGCDGQESTRERTRSGFSGA
jgi:hypothetical protein